MTDQTRVEAVARAIDDVVWIHETLDPVKLAQAAIEASDAWLKANEPGCEWECYCGATGFRPTHHTTAICSVCGDQMFLAACAITGAWS